MANLSLPVRQLMRENIAAMLTFAFSRSPLEALYKTAFVGDWPVLNDTLFQVTQQHAERACLELALLLRYLDDEENYTTYVKDRTNFSFGILTFRDRPDTELTLRDVANKIIHATGFSWGTSSRTGYPTLVCHSREVEKWATAEIELVNLAAVCGNAAG